MLYNTRHELDTADLSTLADICGAIHGSKFTMGKQREVLPRLGGRYCL